MYLTIERFGFRVGLHHYESLNEVSLRIKYQETVWGTTLSLGRSEDELDELREAVEKAINTFLSYAKISGSSIIKGAISRALVKAIITEWEEHQEEQEIAKTLFNSKNGEYISLKDLADQASTDQTNQPVPAQAS